MKTTPESKVTKRPNPGAEMRMQFNRVRRDLTLTETFTALCERYPNPGPKTMAKLEELYVQITGTPAP